MSSESDRRLNDFGTEAVDRAMLDATVIDHAAELAAPEPRRPKTRHA